MGTANSNLSITEHEVQGSKFVVTTRKEETKEAEMDWSGQRSGEKLEVSELYFQRILKGLVSEEDPAKAKQAVDEATEAIRKGNSFFQEYRLDLAKIHYSWAMKVLQNKLSNVEHHKATTLSNIGLIEFAEGRYSEAKALLSEAHIIRTKSALEDQKTVDHIGYNCGSMEGVKSLTVELNRGHQMMFWQSPLTDQLRLCVALKEPETVVIAIADSLSNLGHTLLIIMPAACMEMMGDLEEAEPLYEESLRIKQTVYGDMSLPVADSMQNLVTVSYYRGHLKEAENFLRTASGIYIALLGCDSPEVAVSINNLAVTLCRIGDMSKAQELLEQTVITRLSTFGDDHILTKCATQNLEYVINKKKSIAQSSNGKKGKGKKTVVDKKVIVDQEKAGVKIEVKETAKEITTLGPDKETTGTTAAESNATRMRNTKNINAKEVVSTDVCCSVI